MALVAVGLTRLRQQDERRGVGRLQAEGQVQQDEFGYGSKVVAPAPFVAIQTATTMVWPSRK